MYANSLFSSHNVFGFSSSFFTSPAGAGAGAGVCAHAGAACPSAAIRTTASQPRGILIASPPWK